MESGWRRKGGWGAVKEYIHSPLTLITTDGYMRSSFSYSQMFSFNCRNDYIIISYVLQLLVSSGTEGCSSNLPLLLKNHSHISFFALDITSKVTGIRPRASHNRTNRSGGQRVDSLHFGGTHRNEISCQW